MTKEEISKKLESARALRKRLQEDGNLTELETKNIELMIEQKWQALNDGGFVGNDMEGANLKHITIPEPGRVKISNLKAGEIQKRFNAERPERIKKLQQEIAKLEKV